MVTIVKESKMSNTRTCGHTYHSYNKIYNWGHDGNRPLQTKKKLLPKSE